jgi:hypothetical protein
VKIITAFFPLLLLMTSFGPAAAQLVPAPVLEERGACPNRPPEPVALTSMDFRERSNLGILLKNMYKATAYSNIAQTGTCTCEQRFPDWQPVVDYFLENYAGETDRNRIRERESFYLKSSNSNRSTVREICTSEGNW